MTVNDLIRVLSELPADQREFDVAGVGAEDMFAVEVANADVEARTVFLSPAPKARPIIASPGIDFRPA